MCGGVGGKVFNPPDAKKDGIMGEEVVDASKAAIHNGDAASDWLSESSQSW